MHVQIGRHLQVRAQFFLKLPRRGEIRGNGKITSQSDAISGETISYQYDSLNRLITASASAWSQSYSYDGFGNLAGRVGTYP